MPAKLFAVTAYLLGIAGAGALIAYVVGTGTGYLPRGEPADGAFPWLVNVGLLLFFALQHSGMARPSFKAWWTRVIPAYVERSAYVGISGVLFIAIVLCWQPLPGEPLWRGPIWIVAISLLAAAATGLCCLWFEHATFFGLTQAWTGEVPASGKLRIVGPYRYVRHPQMLGLLVTLWAQPIMPPELLMMNVGWTIYILIALRWEERGLVREFGAAYDRYRHEVPALIPFVW